LNRYWLLLIGFPIVAVPAGWGGVERARSETALRIFSLPPTLQATIVRKDYIVPSGRRAGSPYHSVVLRLPDREITRRIAVDDYNAAQVGGSTPWHVDPATGEGIAGVERSERTTGMIFPYALAFLLAFILCGGIWQGLPGGAAEARVRRGGPGASAEGRPGLPPPPREPTPRWRAWMLKKYPPLRKLLPIPIAGALPFAVGFLLLGFPEPAAIMAVHGGMAFVVILWSHARGFARDRRLWKQGIEITECRIEAKVSGKVWRIEASYTSAGENFTLTQRWPVECDRPGQGILVDPRSFRRATAVPGA
jgi:hypothetical protein